MASVEELIIRLTADNSDLKKKLGESEKSVGGLGKVVSSIGPMIAGAFAVGSVVAFATAAFKAAEQQMQVNKRLLFSLKGNTSAFKELADQAENLRAATGVDDAAIMQIQTLGGAAGYSTDKIKKITAASIELAAVTGQDLQAAYMQVNATFNGSAGRLTRLDAEFGTLSESQLRNGGAVDLLIKKYNGFAAESATETAKLASNWDEFTESLGMALAGTVNPALKDMNGWLTEINNTSGGWGKLMAAINPLHYVIGKTNTQLKAEADYVKESKNQWRDYDIKQSQVGFLKTAEGIKLVAEKTAELRKESKFLNAETEINTDASEKQAKAMAKKSQELNDYMRKVHELAKLEGLIEITYKDMGASDVKGVARVEPSGEKTGLQPKGITQPGDGTKLLARGQKEFGTAIKTTNSELETQMANMQHMQSLMAGFGGAAATAFGEQSAAAKAFAVGQVIAQAAVGIMGTWAGYAKFGPWGTALAVAQTAMIGGVALTQIGNIAGAFASGGIVGGSSMSGDNLTARVNSGEMILNGNQQRELFAMANGMGARNQVEVVGYISGDVIRLANKRSEYILNRRG